MNRSAAAQSAQAPLTGSTWAPHVAPYDLGMTSSSTPIREDSAPRALTRRCETSR
jgi:hypothetical protein